MKQKRSPVKQRTSRYFIPCGLQSSGTSLHEVNGTHAQEMEPGLRAKTPCHLFFKKKKDTRPHDCKSWQQAPNTHTHFNTHLLGLRVIMTFRLCTAPPSVLLGYEVCKWRVICFIHSGADRLYGDVCSRTISTVESTARPNIQDREPIDPFSWVILAPVSGFINRGDVRAHTPYGSLHKLSMACDCGIGAVNTAQTTPCSYSMTS